MKICTKCLSPKPQSEFYNMTAALDGLTHACKPCTKVQNKSWTDRNPGRAKASRKLWAHKNRERLLLEGKERRAGDLTLYNNKRCIRKALTGYRVGSKPHRLLGEVQPIVLRHLLKTWEDRYGYSLGARKCRIDHIVPPSEGGTHHYTNLQLLTPFDGTKKGFNKGAK